MKDDNQVKDAEEWMDWCDRQRLALIRDNAPMRQIEDAEEEYEDARRMYFLAQRVPPTPEAPNEVAATSVSAAGEKEAR